MKKKTLHLIFLTIFIFLIPFKEIFATSKSTIVMEATSGRVLYSNNINSKSLIASTTKIMTCIIVLENSDINKKVTVGDEVLKMYGTNIYIEVGEKLSIKDLLYGLMLRSGNDASVTLAVNVAGSIDNFVSLMNAKAKQLGMKDTIFNNPHGLDEDTKNYSTAHDMALLARYAFNNKEYRKIISTKKYSCKSSIKSYLWYNRVSILNDYKYSLGGKNGYTPSAGKTLVSYAKKNNMTLIIVSLNDSDIYKNHEYLFEDYFSKYKLYKIVDKEKFIYNRNIIKEKIYLKKSFFYPLKSSEKKNISTLIKIGKTKKNKITGYISIKYKDEEIGRLNIYKKKEKKKKDISFLQKIRIYIKNLII